MDSVDIAIDLENGEGGGRSALHIVSWIYKFFYNNYWWSLFYCKKLIGDRWSLAIEHLGWVGLCHKFNLRSNAWAIFINQVNRFNCCLGLRIEINVDNLPHIQWIIAQRKSDLYMSTFLEVFPHHFGFIFHLFKP